MNNIITDKSQQQAAIVRLTGLTYIIIIVIGVLNSIFIDSRLIVYEDITLTINNILSNEFLFRFGSASVLILYLLMILLSVLLYLILKNVNKNLALIAMVFRFGEALLGVTTVLISFIVLNLLSNQFNAASIENTQVNVLIAALLDARNTGLYMVLLLVGLGGTLFFYLFYKSFYIPRILSIWGMFTYLSMLILSLISILFPESPDQLEIVLYGLGTLFELTIGFWLLIKGVNVQ
ncbi:MAG: DUF4386 domain-containing protein [Ignavibacteriaceae bacterium]